MPVKLLLWVLCLFSFGYGEFTLSGTHLEAFVFGDSEEMLADLDPESSDYHFYAVLDAQRRGDTELAAARLTAWAQAHPAAGETQEFLMLKLRQRLAAFDPDDEGGWDWLADKFPLPQAAETRLPPGIQDGRQVEASMSLAEWISWSREREGGLPASVVPRFAHRFLDEAESEEELHGLLAVMTLPVHPRLPEWILADLRTRDRASFGDLRIHRNLTLAQLEALAEAEPALLHQQAYVHERFRRLILREISPEEPERQIEELRGALTFAKALPPRYDWLRQDLLHHLLDRQWRVQGAVSGETLHQFLDHARTSGQLRDFGPGLLPIRP